MLKLIHRQTAGAVNDAFVIQEDYAARTLLSVLSNDPVRSTLSSVHSLLPSQLGSVRNGGGKVPITFDYQGTEFKGYAAAAANGKVALDFTGANFDVLKAGETLTGAFWYQARNASGRYSAAKVTFSIVGQNDPATIAGNRQGEVVEGAETSSASGKLSVSDPDANESRFQTPANLDGVYGDFDFDANSGEWTYWLHNDDPDTRALVEGDEVTETLVVRSLDGTAQESISVTVIGTGTAPIYDFEEGLADWQTIGDVKTARFASEGSFAAMLASTGVDQASIETFLGVAAGTLDNTGNGNATIGSAMKTTVHLEAGQTLSFDWAWRDNDLPEFNDYAFWLRTPGGNIVELADASSGNLGFQTASFTATSAGDYLLAMGVMNVTDESVACILYVDNILIA